MASFKKGSKKKEHLTPEHKGSTWKPIYILTIYRMVRLGVHEGEICKMLGVSRDTLWTWRQKYVELEEAYAIAQRERADMTDLPSWVFSRLSPELQVLWNKIKKWERKPAGAGQIELILQDHGKNVRQQLFLHALVSNSFSPSRAMACVNVTKKELDNWINSDFEFSALVEEIQYHKKNFFEESLVKLVAEGNPAAIMFANKTLNKDRGYAPHATIQHNVSGMVGHAVFDLAEIMDELDMDTRLKVLDAIRRKETAAIPVKTVTDKLHEEIANVSTE